MSESTATAIEAPLLNPAQRVGNVFAAPVKTFADVRRSSGWWVPFLIAAVVGLLYGWVVLHQIGVNTLVDGTIHQSSRLESQISSATPEDAAVIRSRIAMNFKFLYAAPVFSLIFGLIASGVLLASANFGAGGKADFSQMMGVWYYATLPLTVFYLLVIAAIYGGVAGDQFNMKNPIGTNIGFYLLDSDLPKMILPVLSAIDLFALWTAALLTIGVSTVAGISRGAAAAIVFGWWILFILLQVAGAAFGG
jgi:hypothetical protein